MFHYLIYFFNDNKINLNDKKLFFIDYGMPNYEVNFADKKPQLNLEGYIIFGSLASIEKKILICFYLI